MKEKTKKNYSRGGGVLLKKHGPDYFKGLAKRKNDLDRKAKALWKKTEKQKKTKKSAKLAEARA